MVRLAEGTSGIREALAVRIVVVALFPLLLLVVVVVVVSSINSSLIPFLVQSPGHWDPGRFVPLIYCDRMRTAGDKTAVGAGSRNLSIWSRGLSVSHGVLAQGHVFCAWSRGLPVFGHVACR